ncbi:hypothetical protein MY9_0853 [Bacillus sp. JS]|nr:hypothetical protein MY9_0853 [Bacillus sp. JS]
MNWQIGYRLFDTRTTRVFFIVFQEVAEKPFVLPLKNDTMKSMK